MNLKNNYWDEYPEVLVREIFNDFYTKDTTKKKSYSSMIMWGLHLILYPKSLFYNVPDKYTVIAKEFYKDPKFNWKTMTKLLNAYKEFVLTPAEKALNNWNEIMELRDSSLKEMYKAATECKDTDELVKLDKMLSTTAKMFDDYNRVKEAFDNEQLKGTKGKVVALADSDEL